MHTFPRNTYSWRHEGLACTERAQQQATLERQPAAAGKQSENASGMPGPVARQQAVRQKRHRQTRYRLWQRTADAFLLIQIMHRGRSEMSPKDQTGPDARRLLLGSYVRAGHICFVARKTFRAPSNADQGKEELGTRAERFRCR